LVGNVFVTPAKLVPYLSVERPTGSILMRFFMTVIGASFILLGFFETLQGRLSSWLVGKALKLFAMI